MKLKVSRSYSDVVDRFLSRGGHRYILLSGGRGSGKTFLAYNLLYRRMLKFKGDVGVIAKYTLRGMQKSVIDIQEAIGHMGGLFITKSMMEMNGNRYYFEGIKTNSPSKLKSINRMSLLMIDEAQDIRNYQEFSIVDKSIRGGIDRLTVLIFNPTNSKHWIYEHFFAQKTYKQIEYQGVTYTVPISANPNVLHIHSTFLDVPTDSKGRDDIEIDANILFNMRPDFFAHEYMGVPSDTFGDMVFKIKRIKEQDYDYSLPTLIGVDFGFQDPNAVVQVWIDRDAYKIYVKKHLYKSKMTNTEIREFLLNLWGKTQTAMICDTSNKPLTVELCYDKVTIYHKNQKVPLLNQLRKLSDYTILTSDDDIINELFGYVYDDKKGVIGRNGDHLIDAMRYASFELIKY